MTDRDEIETRNHSTLSKLVTVLLFLLAQLVAVLFIGSVALAVSFDPAWSAELQPAALLKPGHHASVAPVSAPTKP